MTVVSNAFHACSKKTSLQQLAPSHTATRPVHRLFPKGFNFNCLCREVVIAEDALIIVIAIVLYKVARRYRVAGFLFEPNSTVTVDNQISS